MKVQELKQTCYACPSQWEGKLSSGQYIYIRYRWGVLRVGIGYSAEESFNCDYLVIPFGQSLDSTMSTEEMQNILSQHNIDFNAKAIATKNDKGTSIKIIPIYECEECPNFIFADLGSVHFGTCKLSKRYLSIIEAKENIPEWCELPNK